MNTSGRTVLARLLAAGLAVALAGVAWLQWRSPGAPPKPTPKAPPGITSCPAAEVFASFRAALRGDDVDAFEAAAVDISGRRLLAGMSRDEIVSALGKPTVITWTPLNPKMRDGLLGNLLARKADYVCYGFYDLRTDHRTVFGLAFDGSRLAWTQFERYTTVELIRVIFTDYSKPPASAPSSRPASSEPGTQPAE